MKAGDQSKAICSMCESLQNTTFQKRNVPIRGQKTVVEELLVAVCDKCDTVVGIPQQSVSKIKEKLDNERISRYTIQRGE